MNKCVGSGQLAIESRDGFGQECPSCGMKTIPFRNGAVRPHSPLNHTWEPLRAHGEAHAAAGSEKDAAELPRFAEKVCPFCGENDFDAWGLKFHLSQGGCDIYNETTREQR